MTRVGSFEELLHYWGYAISGNFRFGREFWVRAKIFGSGENFGFGRVLATIFGSVENFPLFPFSHYTLCILHFVFAFAFCILHFEFPVKNSEFPKKI